MRARTLAARAIGSKSIAAASLFLLNIRICGRLLRFEYTQHFSSVEGFFVSMARYISAHWGTVSWWPIWLCGMPFQDVYVPLVHLAVAAVASLGKISAAHAYHDVTAVTYSLGASALYLMALRLGASRGPAFLSALAYSLFSPSALLQPAIARDLGGWFYCRRLQVLTVYGEGPHVTSLALLPLVVLTLQHALERRTPRSFALASLAIAALFLTNVPGTMATGLAVFCWIAVQPAGRRVRGWAIAMSASVLAYAMACYGAPPSSLALVFASVGPNHPGFYAALHAWPLALPCVLIAAGVFGLFIARSRLPLFARFGLLYFALLAAMVLTARPATFELLPQVLRLHLEMEMAACLLLGGSAWWLYSHSPSRARPLLAVVATIAAGAQVRNYRSWAIANIRQVDPATRSEYTSARWLDTHLPGQRVYATDSDSFWLNAFSDTPNIEGCCSQDMSMPILMVLPYVVRSAASPETTRLAVTYLEALGAQALVASGPQSTDEFKSIEAPERFAALLPVIHREHGDTIYQVPQRNSSLAHVVRPGESVPVRTPREVRPHELVRYAGAIEDETRPAAVFAWLGPGVAHIRATLQPGDWVSVQVAWFAGWKATANGKQLPVSADGLGLILVRPECDGDCEVSLTWAGPSDLRLCAWVATVAITIMAALLLWGGRPRLRGTSTPR